MDNGKRFFTASDSSSTEDPKVVLVQALKGKIIELADLIEEGVPEGRNKSLALTHLEDVQMRANRGIFEGNV